jgi:signal peptidase I
VGDALKRFAWGLTVGLACTDSVATLVRVDGWSMQPTLNPGGGSSDQGSEWVLVEKLSYKWRHKYSRGDVAVLW